jgi:hypothetical protein
MTVGFGFRVVNTGGRGAFGCNCLRMFLVDLGVLPRRSVWWINRESATANPIAHRLDRCNPVNWSVKVSCN